MTTTASSAEREGNVAARLSQSAERWPSAVAVAEAGRGRRRRGAYRQLTFAELNSDSGRIAAALREMGAGPGARLVLLVPPGIDFICLVFALFKAGVIAVLIDPGMGRKQLIRCLEEVEPDGFVAVPRAQLVRQLLARRFPRARLNVTVGRRIPGGGPTLGQLRASVARPLDAAPASPDQPAAIIFTTGSTGPPKGVLYRHGNFARQVDEIRQMYAIRPGEADVAAFPLFALFNAALGVTTVIPDMDATRPADVDPKSILQAVRDWRAVQSFGSPALWNAVGRYCERTGERLPTLRRVLMAGAPAPPHVLRRVLAAIHPEGDAHTPYGATEALPVATIAASEVLRETAARTAAGEGVCVGRRFPGVQWKVIRITDEPIKRLADAEELAPGQIGELAVSGPVVTREYVTRTDCNALHKMRDGRTVWHRMGDVGWLEPPDTPGGARFWFCGRKNQRVATEQGVLYTLPCEAVFNEHPAVYRSALIGVGPPGRRRPVLVVEPWPERRPRTRAARRRLADELLAIAERHPHTRSIREVVIRNRLPVDIRHNAKIFREQLSEWAERRGLGGGGEP